MRKNYYASKGEHCCNELNGAIEDPVVSIHYNAVFREYGVLLQEDMGAQLFQYCPWCRAVLPHALRREWFDILEREYNVEDCLDALDQQTLPKEFRSDEWWKKRQLP